MFGHPAHSDSWVHITAWKLFRKQDKDRDNYHKEYLTTLKDWSQRYHLQKHSAWLTSRPKFTDAAESKCLPVSKVRVCGKVGMASGGTTRVGGLLVQLKGASLMVVIGKVPAPHTHVPRRRYIEVVATPAWGRWWNLESIRDLWTPVRRQTTIFHNRHQEIMTGNQKHFTEKISLSNLELTNPDIMNSGLNRLHKQ